MSVIGFAHGTSHFFHLVIPSLFPWLMPEFGLTFTRAGTLTACFFVISGVGQALAGFIVDRYGAQKTLSAGLGLFALASVAISVAHGYPSLVAASLLAGAGNAVFHPADFTVLNHRVSPARLGHAFSAHDTNTSSRYRSGVSSGSNSGQTRSAHQHRPPRGAMHRKRRCPSAAVKVASVVGDSSASEWR